MDRHLAPLSPPQLVAMTRPAHARIALADATVDATLQASRVPAAVVSGAMRRLASPQGVLARARRAGRQPVNMLAAVDRRGDEPAAGAARAAWS